MRLLKQALAVLGAIAVVAITLALVAPKTVHAVAAALVEVINTSANPVPTYDSGTRFETDVCLATGPISTALNSCGSNTSRTFVVPSVTSGGAAVKRLIVDNVAGLCSSYNNPSLTISSVFLSGQFVPDSVPNGDSGTTHYVPVVAPGHNYVNDPSLAPPLGGVQETDYAYGQSAHFSFNPGDTVTLHFEYSWTGVGATDFTCQATLDGFLATQ